MPVYDHKTIEEKWVKEWIDKKVYQPDINSAENPFYNLMMFPYPSAEGLHVGNMYAFTGADVFGRYQRMRGNDVFEPIGLDGFGIHSENYAIKVGKHPADQAKISQERFYDQLSRIGAGYAWESKLETYDPDYYKWTQWLFVQMFKNGLAYRKSASVNWCPSCKTVLADEQVEDGKCERCKNDTTRKKTEQWFFRITEYADRLLNNIKTIDWPEKIKTAQRNWIGRKEGIDITYRIKDSNETVVCFTTRPDTNFGATFVVLSPEHELVDKIISSQINVPENTKKEVKNYVDKALKKTEQQRKEEGRNKTGVNTNLFAVNQLNGYEMPVFVSDFVLKDFGSGAVVGVPGHDVRDFEFAQEFDLSVIRVVEKDGDSSEIVKVEQVQEDEGKMVNSEFLNGMDIHEATIKMMDHLEKNNWGERVVSYHLRDWLISRQRYWGPPIPMVYCESCEKNGKGEQKYMNGWYSVEENELPVELPELSDYKPTGDGKAPLEKANDKFLYTDCPSCGEKAKRETDVSDTFLDSSWYFMRYPSLRSEDVAEKPFNDEITKKWLPVNAYIGGAEHAVLHLLYSRFVWMSLKDWGHIPEELGDEPFPFLFSHGLIIKDGSKMSKSRGNVIIPDEYIEKYGADSLRMYLMFLGSYDQGGDFRDTGIAGTYRFLSRVWETIHDKEKTGETTSEKLESKLHETIKKMNADLAKFKYNTAIASLMEMFNVWKEEGMVMAKSDVRLVVKLFAPFAPFMSEQIWQQLISNDEKVDENNAFESVHLERYPEFDESKIVSSGVVVVVQVNGKKRGEVLVENSRSGDEKYIVSLAKSVEGVEKWIEPGIKKEIYVPAGVNRSGIVNFVV
ncbi:leucine--tRNA ligase [Patescibacteria group bacterium]